jgi:microsomal dipeptidase-like Zn-dependent dipeptidase
VIADVHCHFPMHLVEWEEEHVHPSERVQRWWDVVRHTLDAEGFELLARLVNHRAFGSGWRVSLDGLRAGGVEIVCSVLYWPFCEFQIGTPYGSPPDPGAFGCLTDQLSYVERKLDDADPDRTRHVVVRTDADLDDARMRFVHCVEGGLHLGPDPDAVDQQVGQLADAGVFYITLAHLLYRGVAAGAPAIPLLTDAEYDEIFPQPAEGLPELGRRAVEAMCAHTVVVDLSHMRRDVIAQTLSELDRSDADRSIPVIASHVGAASAGPPGHAYNLTPDTMRAIRDRGGVIGLIAAQHILGATRTPADSRELLRRHIDAVHDAVGSHHHTAMGTDLDGFIKPTLAGLERAEDLTTLEAWIRDLYPGDADAILHGNAERVLRSTFRLRGRRSTRR